MEWITMAGIFALGYICGLESRAASTLTAGTPDLRVGRPCDQPTGVMARGQGRPKGACEAGCLERTSASTEV